MHIKHVWQSYGWVTALWGFQFSNHFGMTNKKLAFHLWALITQISLGVHEIFQISMNAKLCYAGRRTSVWSGIFRLDAHHCSKLIDVFSSRCWWRAVGQVYDSEALKCHMKSVCVLSWHNSVKTYITTFLFCLRNRQQTPCEIYEAGQFIAAVNKRVHNPMAE